MAALEVEVPASAVIPPRVPTATGWPESVSSPLIEPEPVPTEAARACWPFGVVNATVPEDFAPQ